MQGGHGYGGYGYYDAAGGYYYSNGYDDPAPAAPAYDDTAAALELQPSEACPRNYVILDHTPRTGSSVTFHPALAHNLAGGSPGLYDDGSGCSPAREKDDEDSEEIDALLQSSSEDDAASTGRAPGSSLESSACSSAGAGGRPRKKERIKKMVRALKGVVPGGKQMDTPAVLDEAVWYLRSLKLEATNKKKLDAALAH